VTCGAREEVGPSCHVDSHGGYRRQVQVAEGANAIRPHPRGLDGMAPAPGAWAGFWKFRPAPDILACATRGWARQDTSPACHVTDPRASLPLAPIGSHWPAGPALRSRLPCVLSRCASYGAGGAEF
jgi:hypothetical protein